MPSEQMRALTDALRDRIPQDGSLTVQTPEAGAAIERIARHLNP